jgi:hypothetical protein
MNRLHAQAIIRDGKDVFFGSQSLRKVELDRWREVGLITNDREAVKNFFIIFEMDWGDIVGRRRNRKRATVNRRFPRPGSGQNPPPAAHSLRIFDDGSFGTPEIVIQNLIRTPPHAPRGAPGAQKVECWTGNSPSTASKGLAMKFPSAVNPVGPSCAAVKYWRSNRLLIWPKNCNHLLT